MTRKIDTDAVIYAIRMDEQAGDPAQPAAGYWLIYTKAGGLYIEDSAGNVTGPMAESGVADLTAVPLAVFFPPGEPPSANYATFDTRNQHPVLDFDDATDESIVFTGILGDHYAGGGVTVSLYLTDTNDTNAAHASYWDVSFERMIGLDIDGDSFAVVQSSHVHPNGTSGIPVICTIAFTDGAQMDSVAAGELFRIKVTRDANNGSDDWSGDAELLCVKIMET